MLKCKNGHDILKGHGFCGQCGGGAVEEPDSKCGGCAGTFTKSQGDFCPKCGTKNAASADELDRAAGDIGDFIKARAVTLENLNVLPAIEADDVDDAPLKELIKANTQTDAQGETYLEAAPVVAELLRATNINAAAGKIHAEHILKGVLTIAEDNTRLLRTMAAMAGELVSLRKSVDELGHQPRGRKASIAVLPTDGSRGGAAAATIEDQGDDVDGRTLFAKAHGAWTKDKTVLNIEEMASLEQSTGGMQGGGMTLKGLIAYDPYLADRVIRATGLEVPASATH